MKNTSKFKLLPTTFSLVALLAGLSISNNVAYSRGFGGGGFDRGGGGFDRGGGGFDRGGGGFDRGGFSGDFHGQGSVMHSGQGFKSPESSAYKPQAGDEFKAPTNPTTSQQTRTNNVNSAENTRTNNVNSAENTRTNNVNSAENTRTNNVNSAENTWHNSYVNNGSWYGGGGCCGGWGWGAAGLATGVVLGASLSSIPAGYVPVSYNGLNYYYVNGNYYLPNGSNYTLVAPPVGVSIATLPTGYTTVYATGSSQPYYYANGFYYENNAGKYVIVNPPKGAMVPYLPQGYTTATLNGVPYYKYAGVTYRPYYSSGDLVYVVN